MDSLNVDKVPCPDGGNESITAGSGVSRTDHLHVRIAWIRGRLPGPAPCSSPGLHDPMRTVCRQNGRILPACFSPPVCLAIDDHSCFIYAICDGNNSPHLNYRHCHRRQRCTFHRAIGARQGVRHWRRRRRGSPLITRALPSPTPCFTQVEITIVSSARGPGKAS